MADRLSKDPLHGISLKFMLEALVARRGWDDLANCIDLRCFAHEPSLKSSLKFLRRTDWARRKVEALYLDDQAKIARNAKRNRRRASMRAFKTEQPGPEDSATAPTGGEDTGVVAEEVIETRDKENGRPLG